MGNGYLLVIYDKQTNAYIRSVAGMPQTGAVAPFKPSINEDMINIEWKDYTDEWGDFIYLHRDESYDPPFMHSFDVVYGPIANDRVGLQIRNRRLGNIDRDEFLLRLKYMKGITFQYAFCTQKAIETLQRYECE